MNLSKKLPKKIFRGNLKNMLASLSPVLVVLMALLIGAGLILIEGHNPIDAYLSLVKGAFGSKRRISETLVKTTPLLLMGLAVSVAFKNSFWNIGGEGQFIAGALFATFFALKFSNLPGLLLGILCFLAGFLGGAFWCVIPGLMKVYFNVNEVISSLMLNYVALYILRYLIRGPMMYRSPEMVIGQVFPQSARVPEKLFLPLLVERTRLHLGLVFVLIILALVFFLWKTRIGFEIELSGKNIEAAKYAGMKVNSIIILVTIISGGLAGLVGWNEIFGVHHRLLDDVTAGYGFLGLVVALLGDLNPLGIMISAVLFSALKVGGHAMERATGVSFAVVTVINGLVIIFVLIRAALQQRIRGEL